jgi:hypothetical protein
VLVLGLLASPAWAQQFKSITLPLQTAQTGDADGNEITIDGMSSLSVQVTISGTATVTFEATQDQSTWASVACIQVGDTTYTSITDTTATMTVRCNVAGLVKFRTRTSGNSGSVTTTATSSPAVMGSGGGGGGGGAGTLDQAFDGGKVIDGANSLANAMCVGATLKLCFYEDATLGPLIRPSTDANTRTYIWSGFNWSLYTVGGSSPMLTVDPALTDNEKYAWASGSRPIKTIPLPADALYPRGASTLVTDTALISGGLISPYITITDSDSDGFYRYLVMPANWDGGTVTATVTVVNVNATPANAFEVDVSGACYPAGTVIPTTISTTGEQAATVSFGASGSCGGSACNQNDPASATTAAITINGTPAGGNFCGFQAQVDATATTETVAGIKITQMDIHYKIAKGF